MSHQLLNIEVRDTGIGIPQDKQAAIFEPFNQVDNSNSRQFGGAGLGLAIVSNLVQAMNGHISLESEPGRGCTFNVLIPLATQRAVVAQNSNSKSSGREIEAEAVLTV